MSAEPTPAALDAEIAEARAAYTAAEATPFTSEAARQAATQRFEAAYQARYGGGQAVAGDVTPEVDPDIATLSPSAARARITAIRGLMKNATDIEDDRLLQADLLAAYKRLHEVEEGEEATPAAPPASAENQRFALPAGHTWDHAAWAGFRAATTDEPMRQAIDGVRGAMAAAITSGYTYTKEASAETLVNLIGDDHVDEAMELAEMALAHPAITDEYFKQFMAHPAQLNQHPRVILALAEVGRRLKAASRAG